MASDDIISRTRLLENEIRIMRLEQNRITHEIQNQRDKIRENSEKIKVNKTLPYLVSNVIEVDVCVYMCMCVVMLYGSFLVVDLVCFINCILLFISQNKWQKR